MTRWRLRPDVRLHVEYDDQTPCGGPLGQRLDWATREAFGPLLDHVEQHGQADLHRLGPRLLAACLQSEAFARLGAPAGDGWTLRPDVLHPDPTLTRPAALALAGSEGGAVECAVPADAWPAVHAALAALAGPGLANGEWSLSPETGLAAAERSLLPEAAGAAPRTLGADAPGAAADEPALSPEARLLLTALRDQALVAPAEAPAAPDPRLAAADLVFLGHNTVLAQSATTRLLVDPFLFASSPAYPPAYQPLPLAALGPLDAVLITHCHPDHFAPASLLQLPLATRLIVPRVARETALAADLAARLRELGFTRVEALDWGEDARVGDVTVRALPFYGEQPTEGPRLYPDVRNAGNTYLVQTPRCAAVFLADSGRDLAGDVQALALEARERYGPVDVVFSGYRGWLTYPPQLLLSSVARYLLFAPPALWGVRQQLMTTADGAVDVAERWGARYLVPYADGGAPWHWQIGLGPRLDEAAAEIAGFDPLPERVLEAARERTPLPEGGALASPVQPLLLRPNDALCDVRGTPRLKRLPGHAWPYAEAAAAAESYA